MTLTMSLTTTPGVSAARKEVLNAAVTDDLISDEATRLISWIMYLLCEIIAIVGTVANIINIICYVRLDLKDAINISFLGLAISDLGSLIILIWASLCMTPLFLEIDAPFDPVALQSIVSGWPHIACTRITSWITALITLERCLCITMPLMVRRILTPKRVTITIICIFLISIAGISPIYSSSSLAWGFSSKRNKTILKAVYSQNRVIVEQIVHGITNVFSPFAAYITIVTCTVILVVKLRQKTKWRMKSAASVNADTMSVRDQKVAKMVVMISAVFIICFVPLCAMFVAMILEPRISVDGDYENVILVLAGVLVLLEGTNSALNIVIYYKMSTKYREVFHEVFRCGKANRSLDGNQYTGTTVQNKQRHNAEGSSTITDR